MVEQRAKNRISALPGQFSLFSLGIFAMVVAAMGLSASYLFRAAEGNSHAMGTFVLVTSMAPLILLLFVSILFQFLRFLFK